jgi:hypothetical protein
MKRTLIVAVAGLTASLAGCAHYSVTDLQSGKTYYTRMLNRNLDGDVRFKDAETGSKVKLETYEVTRITRGEFDRAVPDNRHAAR